MLEVPVSILGDEIYDKFKEYENFATKIASIVCVRFDNLSKFALSSVSLTIFNVIPLAPNFSANASLDFVN